VTKTIDAILAEMRNNPGGIRFADAMKICVHYFGKPRKSGSHRVFKMPWPGDPRVNLQEDKGGRAKAYQVRQIVRAVDLLTLVRRPTDKGEGQS
jgi:hypothetical protein